MFIYLPLELKLSQIFVKFFDKLLLSKVVIVFNFVLLSIDRKSFLCYLIAFGS